MTNSPEVNAAIKGELQRTYHGRALAARLIIAPLLTYFDGRGEGVTEIPLGSRSDVDEWRDEWRELADDAGITSKVDQQRLIQWLNARNGLVLTTVDRGYTTEPGIGRQYKVLPLQVQSQG